MHKECLSALELVRRTTGLLRSAPTATTGITRMVARLTATTARTTLLTACLSVLDRGSTASTADADSTAAVTMDAAIMDVAPMGDLAGVTADAISAGAEASTVAASEAAIVAFMVAEASEATPAASMAVQVSTAVEVASMVVVEVSTVAADTVADTGNFSEFHN